MGQPLTDASAINTATATDPPEETSEAGAESQSSTGETQEEEQDTQD